MSTTIQLLSIVLLLTLALPGTTILWTESTSINEYFRGFLRILKDGKLQFLESVIPGLKRIVAMLF